MGLFSTKSDDLIVTQLAAHQAEILAYIHSQLPGNSSVNDVLQRTNLVIWKKRAMFEEGTNFRAWAFSVARWEVRAFLKESKRKSWLVIDDDLAQQITDTMTETADDGYMMDLREDLELCMKKLKSGERELITHRYHTEGTLREYAEAGGRSVGSLKVTLCRIRATLKRCIESRQIIHSSHQIERS